MLQIRRSRPRVQHVHRPARLRLTREAPELAFELNRFADAARQAGPAGQIHGAEGAQVSRLVTVILSLTALFGAVGLAWAQGAPVEPPAFGLQTELEPVDAAFDWRSEVGLRDADSERQLPDWIGWIIANFIAILLGLFAALILGLVLWVLVRQGGAGGFNTAREAAPGERAPDPEHAAAAAVGAPRLTLEEILALEDLRVALGALLRLTLEAALRLSGAALRRSATARDILRRLPQDFAHLQAVAVLVREAEAVRFGGADISRDRFDVLVDLVRPLLAAEAKP